MILGLDSAKTALENLRSCIARERGSLITIYCSISELWRERLAGEEIEFENEWTHTHR